MIIAKYRRTCDGIGHEIPTGVNRPATRLLDSDRSSTQEPVIPEPTTRTFGIEIIAAEHRKRPPKHAALMAIETARDTLTKGRH